MATKTKTKAAGKSSKAVSSKSKSVKKEKASAPKKIETPANVDWGKDGVHWDENKKFLDDKKAQYEKGKLDGHTYNQYIRPLLESFELGQRSEHMHVKIQKIADGVFEN